MESGFAEWVFWLSHKEGITMQLKIKNLSHLLGFLQDLNIT